MVQKSSQNPTASVKDLYGRLCEKKANGIIRDPGHPALKLFRLAGVQQMVGQHLVRHHRGHGKLPTAAQKKSAERLHFSSDFHRDTGATLHFTQSPLCYYVTRAGTSKRDIFILFYRKYMTVCSRKVKHKELIYC